MLMSAGMLGIPLFGLHELLEALTGWSFYDALKLKALEMLGEANSKELLAPL